MKMNKEITHIRFPNESYYDEIENFNITDFRLEQEFNDCVFGVWQEVHVFIEREDYEKHKIMKQNTSNE